MSDARRIAEALAGRRVIRLDDGSYLTCCPVPGHGRGRGDLHPSLHLADGDRRLLVRCYSRCDPRDVLNELRRRGLIERSESSDEESSARPRKPAPIIDDRDEEAERRRKLEIAAQIWKETASIVATAGEAYLAKRGIPLNNVPSYGGLRWHPKCPWHKGTTPCIVARFTDAVTGEPRGIWRRPINGEKPRTLGPMGGCVIRLWPDENVESGLVIGEGVETVLAGATRCIHKGTLLRPAWATCSAGNLERFPILDGIEELTILVDNDVNNVGQDAAKQCAIRWLEASRPVRRLTPKFPGTDFNDLVLR
jgi:putative DNA primase/helicase